MRSADPEMPRLLQNRMKMSPLLSTVPVTATSKPSRYRSIHAHRSPAQRPVSGQYCGDSAEDDQGDQAVVSNLKFGADGSITGDGIDGVDGAYTLSGRWAGDRCAWIERYHDGFEVAVTGTVERSGDIFILFCSSRGISGSADLKLRTAA